MYCSRCGTAQADNAAFCGACGQPLGAALRSAAPPPAIATTPPSVPPLATATPVPAVYSPYAGFWLRFVAYVIDGLMCVLVFGVFLLILIAIIGVGTIRGQDETFNNPENFFMAPAIIFLILTTCIVAVCGSWLYYALFESSVHQERSERWHSD